MAGLSVIATLFVIAVAWLVIGLVLSLVMGRRGLTDSPVGERTRALEELERCAAEAESLAVSCTTVLLAGVPDRALVEYGRENGYGLLVVGHRGRGLSRHAFGSTATRLAAGSPIPVLVVSTPNGATEL